MVKERKFRLIKAPFHICSICGYIDNWGKSWRWTLKLHGKGYDGWEETIELCSDKCQEIYEKEKAEGGVVEDGRHETFKG